MNLVQRGSRDSDVALGAVRGASGNRVVFSKAVNHIPSVPPIWNKEANELTSAPFTQNSGHPQTRKRATTAFLRKRAKTASNSLIHNEPAWAKG